MAIAEERELTGRGAKLIRAAVALGALALMSLALAAPASGAAERHAASPAAQVQR